MTESEGICRCVCVCVINGQAGSSSSRQEKKAAAELKPIICLVLITINRVRGTCCCRSNHMDTYWTTWDHNESMRTSHGPENTSWLRDSDVWLSDWYQNLRTWVSLCIFISRFINQLSYLGLVLRLMTDRTITRKRNILSRHHEKTNQL